MTVKEFRDYLEKFPDNLRVRVWDAHMGEEFHQPLLRTAISVSQDNKDLLIQVSD